VPVGVSVTVDVSVGVALAVLVGVFVGVSVGVGVGVLVKVGVGVEVSCAAAGKAYRVVTATSNAPRTMLGRRATIRLSPLREVAALAIAGMSTLAATAPTAKRLRIAARTCFLAVAFKRPSCVIALTSP